MHQHPAYGVASIHYAPLVASAIKATGATTILDYGAGKGRLAFALPGLGLHGVEVKPYDPAVPEWAAPPAPAPLVACLDVLEHVEPECLDAVLDDLARCTAPWGIFTVATRPAIKELPDGRNTHLIIEPYEWWEPRIKARWEIRQVGKEAGEFYVFVKKLLHAPQPQ